MLAYKATLIEDYSATIASYESVSSKIESSWLKHFVFAVSHLLTRNSRGVIFDQRRLVSQHRNSVKLTVKNSVCKICTFTYIFWEKDNLHIFFYIYLFWGGIMGRGRQRRLEIFGNFCVVFFWTAFFLKIISLFWWFPIKKSLPRDLYFQKFRACGAACIAIFQYENH